MAYSFENREGVRYFVERFYKYNFEGAFENENKTETSHRYRSWEYCRKAFLDQRGKELSDETVDRLALHLAFYLASWGMYRGSSFLLSLDYTVHRPAVRMLMDKKYDELFDCDELLKTEKGRKKYLDLLMGIDGELNAHYASWHAAVRNKDQSTEDISGVLRTKILMGVYGCIPAYDRYVMDGLKTQGINATFGEKAVKDLLKSLFEKEDGKLGELIQKELEEMRSTQQEHTNFNLENYTLMKMVDMLFWEIGAGEDVFVSPAPNQSPNTLKEIEEALKAENFEKKKNDSYSYTINNKTFKSSDLGALLFCAYDELKISGRKKEMKKYIEENLQPDFNATTRYTKYIEK